ncbi:glycosyltransferase family 9 protein [Solidesulfovibrio magneticus]|uniref:Glycosyltransferase n=1 Tax=Solidesulfovibrio magneticus (strain ATCC 700980 / DSM 13731 / RS-1) TaxID=573370 RepID=C4XST8_SOLM1|nr:glycosyltransferase family 9 protein [Solidesulfovibrio magneticus]BAH75780.1 putative glycosyltransferase [Solidesulfovibrio magneticus RS-1]
MNPPDKIVLEHAGALGDFFLAWPAFLSVVRRFPGAAAFAAVRPSLAGYLAPLAAPCPPDLRRTLDARFAAAVWPKALANTLVIRPGLAARPELPPSDRFLFLPGVVPGSLESPRGHYRKALETHGIPWAEDWREMFQTLFGSHAPTTDDVLLFPGAGHPDKCWPLDRLAALAKGLAARGLRPVYVLGPAELERGLAPAGSNMMLLETVEELSLALRAARAVVGPDCGPLHLAGLHGVPGVAVFGPTSPRQWGPVGLDVITAGMACAPCAVVTSGAFAAACPRPLPCLAGVGHEAVLERLMALTVARPRAGQYGK